MKCFGIFSIIAVCAASVIKDPKRYIHDNRYFADDGLQATLFDDSRQTADKRLIEEYMRNPDNNAYWLYTRSNPNSAQILRHGDARSVLVSNFEPLRNTVFLVHGWTGDGNHVMNTLLTEAFLFDDDVNVIVLDWAEMANQGYFTSKAAVAEIGRALGQFINWLVELGASYELMHLVGQSLGAHLVGIAGRETGGRVQRITATDPALPLWLLDANRLASTDGIYVEVIHTNNGRLGYPIPCGDTDFYPNGGWNMPGCSDIWCSHDIAFKYMAASVKYNHFLANECGSLFNAFTDNCSGHQEYMGNSGLSPKQSGIYRVNTASEYPF